MPADDPWEYWRMQLQARRVDPDQPWRDGDVMVVIRQLVEAHDTLAARSEPGAEGLREDGFGAGLTTADTAAYGYDVSAPPLRLTGEMLDRLAADFPISNAATYACDWDEFQDFALAATPAADSRGLDVDDLERAMREHILGKSGWPHWRGGPTPGDGPQPIDGCDDLCADRIAREYAALTDPDPAP